LVRSQPYYAQFRAVDIVPIDSISLVSLQGVFIRVIAPPPPALTATPIGNTIRLDWTAVSCSNAIGYRIYRRNGSYPGNIPCPCDNGAPSYTGYQLIDTTSGLNATTFLDDNNGGGLVIGVEYCYIVTAVFPDGSESCASPQACASLKKDLPVITNADVRTTDPVTGSVYVAWSKPAELDTVQFPPPYEYRIYRSPDFNGGNLSLFATANDLNDTTVIDTLTDTQTHPSSYRIELWYTAGSVLTLKGSSAVASTVFLTLSPSDNLVRLDWQESVPWSNDSFVVFRRDPSAGQFDSVATTVLHTYTDTGLVNGETYCYFVRSTGGYSFPGFVDPIVNRSQRVCAVPVDDVPPCAPQLSVNTYCTQETNRLIWNNPNNTCADDVVKYYIYYSLSSLSGYERIDSLMSPVDTVYLHQRPVSLSGCYKVTAVDATGNETTSPLEVCVDTCRQYVLPSVFTPNGDGFNDLFHPCDSTTEASMQQLNCPPYRNVKDIDLHIYNRWGRQVFHTDDRDINWDGKDESSGQVCSDGIYYYTCEVRFFTLNGIETAKLHGTLQIAGTGR
jgi:gliding motility-associated-like protein